MVYLLQAILVQFYTPTIESILVSVITIWFGAASSEEIRKLQRAVRMAKNHQWLRSAFTTWLVCLRIVKANRKKKIFADTSHPANSLLRKLTSGRCFRSLITKTA